MADEEELDIDINEWKKLKVAELRNRVNELGLETKGTKAELIARVEKYLNEQEADLLEEVDEEMGGADDEVGGAGEEMGGADDEVGGADTTQEGSNTETENKPTTISSTNESSKEELIKIEYQPPSVIKGETPVQSKVTEADKLKKRKEKFGDNGMAKIVARSERFGTPINKSTVLGKRTAGQLSTESLEKMKVRANRFGISGGSKIITKLHDEEKRKDRASRFNLKPVDMTMEDRKQTRMGRFGTS